MKRRAIILAALMCGVGLPAHASEWINCGSADNVAEFSILVGFMDVMAISAVTMAAGETKWSSAEAYGKGTPIAIGQAYEDAETIRVDAMDDNLEGRIGELRLFKATEGDGDTVLSGTLRIPGHGAWAVTCSGL